MIHYGMFTMMDEWKVDSLIIMDKRHYLCIS